MLWFTDIRPLLQNWDTLCKLPSQVKEILWMYVIKPKAMPNENRRNESQCNQLTVPHHNCACNLQTTAHTAIKIKCYYLITWYGQTANCQHQTTSINQSTGMYRMRRFLAVLRSIFHSSLSYTFSCHSSPPNILPSSLTSSSHLFLGLPLGLVVSRFIYSTLLGILFDNFHHWQNMEPISMFHSTPLSQCQLCHTDCKICL